MVTGIEVTGIALAIFPLVIEGLKSYSNGARTIKDVLRPQMALKSLIRELGMEQCKFENTLTSLLEGIVSESDQLSLMNDPGGELWYTEDLQNTLESRLRTTKAVQVYVDSMNDLLFVLKTLEDKFVLGSECESDAKRALKRKWKNIRLVLSKEEYKEQLNQISKINSDLQTLTGQTNSTNTAIVQTTASLKNYKRIRNYAMSLDKVLKEKLQPLKPFCQCSTPHNASLQLEMRNATFRQKGFGKNISIRFHVVISFERAVGAGIPPLSSWRDIGLEPVDTREEGKSLEDEQTGNTDSFRFGGAGDVDLHSHLMPSPPEVVVKENTRRKISSFISNIAKSGVTGFLREDNTLSKISSLAEPHNHNPMQRTSVEDPWPLRPSSQVPRRESRPTTPKNVSFTESSTPQVPVASGKPTNRIEHMCLIMQQEESGQSCLGVLADKSRQYLVWPLIPSSSPESTEFKSLGSLLAQRQMPRVRDRLILGVQLASTVLQLHKTGWLSENWNNEDIYFHGSTSEGQVPDFKRPFVRQSPGLSLPETQETKRSTLIPHDQSLFSLGIILVELWYARPLEELRKEEDESESRDDTNFKTAKRLASQISSDADAKYGDAVRRCIKGLDHRSESLDVDDFKSEVHMKVVAPLVESLEYFCDKDISQIFPERRKFSVSRSA